MAQIDDAKRPERARDFLWRENADGTFFMLSARPPADPHNLFDLDAPKQFAPHVVAGDRLRFSLRANPVVRRETQESRLTGKHKKIKKHDVVMQALHKIPKRERSEPRKQLIQETGAAWLARQGERCGFAINLAAVTV